MATKKEKAEAKLAGENVLGEEVVLVEEFSGELSALEPGQLAKHPAAPIWFFKTPNGLLIELPDNRILHEEDGTLSVPVAMSAEGLDPDTDEHLMWTGTITHGKVMSNE